MRTRDFDEFDPIMIPLRSSLAYGSLAGYGSLARTTSRKMPLKPFVLQAFPRGGARLIAQFTI